jgi:hypothetical protein
MNISIEKPTKVLNWFLLILMIAFMAGLFLSEWQDNTSLLQLEESVVKNKEDHLVMEIPLRGSSSGDAPLPLAWLMSFPNSGTSYTINMVMKVTGRNTASNYGSESQGEDGMSVDVFAKNGTGTAAVIALNYAKSSASGLAAGASNQKAGPPFWISPKSRTLSRPSKGYILTKTHCGSRCQHCSVSDYVENHALFLQHCLEGRYNIKDNKGILTEKLGSYDKALVKRAVHLIRDPFDNVVSRFHLHYKHLVKKNRTDQVAAYPRTREGFRRFCNDEGKHYNNEEKHSKFYADVFETVKDVPCHADFYRYIQWHNLAFTTTWDLNIPSMIVHYENYTDNFNKTKDALLEFLGQDGIYNAPAFVTGKTYREYYLQEEITALHVMFSKLALEKTWYSTKHYFV